VRGIAKRLCCKVVYQQVIIAKKAQSPRRRKLLRVGEHDMTQEFKTLLANEKSTRLRQKKTSVPFLWRLIAALGLTGLSGGCFFLVLRLSGTSAPFISEQNRDTLFFAFLAGIVLFLMLIPAVSVLLQGCAEKRPAWTIIKDVVKTMTVMAVQSIVAIIVEALLGNSRSNDRNSSSSDKGTTKGGGGSFGGGGSSGTF
jgi:hypothetical protein